MFCPKCGESIPDGGKFCAGCGHALPQANTAAPAQAEPVSNAPVQTPPTPGKPKKAMKKSKLPLIIVALVVVVAIVVGAIALLGSSGKESVCIATEYITVSTNVETGEQHENTRKTEYVFDDDGNLESYIYEYDDGQGFAYETEIEVEYDKKGNIETVTLISEGGESEFEYIYEGNELVEVVCDMDDGAYIAYFEDGRIISVEADMEDEEHEVASYEYDDDVLVEKVVDKGITKTVTTYNEDGKVIKTKTYMYDELYYSYSYEYNEEGDLSEQVQTTYYNGEKQTTVTTFDYTYDKDGRAESCVIGYDYGDESFEVEMIYDWESDTECVITYDLDDLEGIEGAEDVDFYIEQEEDEDGNVLHQTQYVNGEISSESIYTYEKLTKKQQEQMDQIAWIIDIFG